MKALPASLILAALLVSFSGPSAAYAPRRAHLHHYGRQLDNSPSAIAERQRHASTFDNTQYYEHDPLKIPMGTLEWWNNRGGY